MSPRGAARPLVLAFALAGLAACMPAPAPAPAPVPAPAKSAPASPVCRVVSVTDGDTLRLSCDGSGAFAARLIGVDAPEIVEGLCATERSSGLRAKAALADFVALGPVTAARFSGQENRGRRLVRLEVAGRDAATAMIDAGVALPFDGTTYPDWCTRP